MVVGLAAPRAADTFGINVYGAPRLADVVLDGRLDEAGWQQAPLAGGFTLFGKETRPSHRPSSALPLTRPACTSAYSATNRP